MLFTPVATMNIHESRMLSFKKCHFVENQSPQQVSGLLTRQILVTTSEQTSFFADELYTFLS